ncbi:hypothetical protein IID24_03005 [Patescibacteria group bacterium]|nr:hypothetical protein [Patescibacteria group bacterium]
MATYKGAAMKNRFDILIKGNRAWIEPHVCREDACYGLSFEAAKEVLVKYYQEHAKHISTVKKEDWKILGSMERLI